MPKKLETMDAETLMTTPMEPLKFVVSGLIPEGLHVFAGSPKIGKSWLALWICLQVAKGEKVWGFETNKSEVLYLCLEDSFARIQSRLFEITDEAPPTLHFAIMSNAIGNGLEQQIKNFITEHPDKGLMVIDTLQKVRKTVSANVNPYASDYDDINALKQIADRHHLAILLVHHLRKTGDADPLNMISGTSGIAGGADTNFVLQKDKRTENAFTEFMATKSSYKKADRTMFYHYDQAFKDGETISPKTAHEIAVKFAEDNYPDFEVVIATHVDNEHLHSHFIINSVSFKTGKKLHEGPKTLLKLRAYSDQICNQYGLTTLEPYTGGKSKSLASQEYRAAAKGQSWKFALMNAIDTAMKISAPITSSAEISGSMTTDI